MYNNPKFTRNGRPKYPAKIVISREQNDNTDLPSSLKLQDFGGLLPRLPPNPCDTFESGPGILVTGPIGSRITFGAGLGGGVLVLGPSCSKGLDDPKIRSLASWYFASRSARVCGTGEGEAEEVFEGVVGVGRLSILIGAWMTIGGGGETTVAEVDDLEMTSCGIGDFVFLTPYLN